jgi:murein DD-endopeptidase MepM/ murein hydrolase activator NlpD
MLQLLLGLAAILASAPAVAQPVLDWPVLGKVVSEFAPAPPDRMGIDILAPLGTPFRASADGQVVYVGNQVQGQGNMVLIQHADKLITAYTSALCIAVRTDDIVQQGQIVGYVGNTGNRDEAALHFEVRQGGKALNPRGFLPSQAASRYGPHRLDGAVLPCIDYFDGVKDPPYFQKANHRSTGRGF